MKFALTLMLLSSASAYAAPTLICTVSPNGSGVSRVEFVNPLSSSGDFKNLLVSFVDGSSDEYTTEDSTTVDSTTAEETQYATFSNLKKPGLASLKFVFFTRPQDSSPHGWSPKHGARMKLILPPAIETIRLACNRSL
jgi:hypothetical protein